MVERVEIVSAVQPAVDHGGSEGGRRTRGKPEMLKSMFPVNLFPDAELVKTWLVSCCGFGLLLWYLSFADLAT